MTSSYRLALISNQAFSIINFRGPLVRSMVAQGMTVFAFAPDYDDNSRSAVKALGAVPQDFSMARVGMNPLRDVIDLVRLSIQLSRLKLDATFSYFIKPVIYGTLAARLARVPKRIALIEGAGYVFTHDKKLRIGRYFLRTFVTWLYRIGLSQAHNVFLLNPDDRKMFVAEHMVAEKKTLLLDGIGVDLDHYRSEKSPFLNPPSFILVARLLREKGIYEYIEAARNIKKTFPATRFLLLGNVDHNPGSILEDEVFGWVAEGVVEWPGQVVDVRYWLEQASVFVLPSYREGLPRSTQEAMAMGRPVITTDVPGCRETVENGVNGFLISARDTGALEQAMKIFIDHPEMIESMGNASRRMAEKRFNVHTINAQILKVMQFRCGGSH